jgi:hypothetical protein
MRLKRSTSKDETKKAQRDQKIKDAYSDYIDLVESIVNKCKQTIRIIQEMDYSCPKKTFRSGIGNQCIRKPWFGYMSRSWDIGVQEVCVIRNLSKKYTEDRAVNTKERTKETK